MEMISWNRCFVCSSVLGENLTEKGVETQSNNEKGENVVDECTKISPKEEQKKVDDRHDQDKRSLNKSLVEKPPEDILLEYLLTHCKVNRIIGKFLLDDIKKLRLMKPKKDDKQRTKTNPVKVEFCNKCQQFAEEIRTLHLELEFIQMKIVDKLVTLKQSVILNSREFGCVNSEVRTHFKKFEDSLKQQERVGSYTFEICQKFLQALQQFQRTVFESDTRAQDIPLTHINVGAINNFTREDNDETDSEEDEDPFQPHQFLRTEITVGDNNLNVGTQMRQRRRPKIQVRRSRRERMSSSTVSRRTLAARTKKLKIQMTKKRETTAPKVIVEGCSGQCPNQSCSKNLTLEHIPTPTIKSIPATTEAMELAKRFRREWMTKRKENKLKLVGQVKCEICSHVTVGQPRVEQHLREHETHETNHQCPDCERKFTTRQYFEHHIMYHCGMDLWRCDGCEKPIARRKVKAHIRELHEDKVYSCHQCDCFFTKFPTLVLHSLAHIGQHTINCEMCSGEPVPFSSKRGLLRHLSEKHNQVQLLFKCDFESCTATYVCKSDLWSHKQSHSMPSFGCPTCGRCFINNFRLQLHIKTLHKNEKVYQCTKCSQKFRTIGDREKHMQSDHGVSNYKCDLCPDEVFLHATSLRLHKYRKHGERVVPQYHCSFCPKIFVHRGKCRDHERTHSDVKEFICEICAFKTRTERLLKAHKSKHEDVKNYACTYCPKRFAHKKYLTCHIRIHTFERPFQCDICQQAFNQQGALKVHKKKHLRNIPFSPRGSRVKKKKQANLDEYLDGYERIGKIVKVESTRRSDASVMVNNVEPQTPKPNAPGPSSSAGYFDETIQFGPYC